MRTESLRDLLSQFPDVDGFWDFDDLIRTEDNIRQLLSKEEPSQSPKMVDYLTQLARVQGLQGKLTEAGATLLLAKELISKHSSSLMVRSEIRFLIEQGRFFSLSMSPSQSLASFEKAWNQASASSDVFRR